MENLDLDAPIIVDVYERTYQQETVVAPESVAQINANGSFSKTSRTGRTVVVQNPNYSNITFTCEYWALVTVSFKKQNGIITQVTSTGFNVEGMTYPFGFENVRIPVVIASNGSNCSATANYDVYRYFEIGYIPIKFSKNCIDNVIAYAADY